MTNFKLTKSFKDIADRRIEKMNELTRREPTEANITKFAETIELPIDQATKYFKTSCPLCGKEIKYQDIAMYLRYFGRYEGVNDTRKFYCKDCNCKNMGLTGREYWLKIYENIYDECGLF